MTVLAVIPARWDSTRFPGKPLAKIAGREMIAHVWDRVVQTPSVDKTVVATDADNIADFCKENDMNVVMTEDGRLIEVQSTAEGDPFARTQLDELLDLARAGIGEIIVEQKRATIAFADA